MNGILPFSTGYSKEDLRKQAEESKNPRKMRKGTGKYAGDGYSTGIPGLFRELCVRFVMI